MARHDKSGPCVPSELELEFDSIWKGGRPPEFGPLEQRGLGLPSAQRLVILSSGGMKMPPICASGRSNNFRQERPSA